MNTQAIDFEHLNTYLGGEVSLIAEVFGLFKNQVEMWSKMMNADADDDSWASVMHSLKGSARAVGAARLAGLCAHGEELVGASNSPIRRAAHIDEIRFEIDRALIEIGRWEYRQTLASMRSGA
ncbi:MAG TPA: hypothetical protein ENK01_03260 [Hellea balneolensis]|uniref:HPt domain-containing protein n=1 Tax=Hellea balneolensis TaxID=287478 RepID=A0A7V5U1B2_9PROT|nr:hypothetical protein [Hellea balneolensis]